MAEIELTRGRFAVVDDADAAWLSKWRWEAAHIPKTDDYFAFTRRKIEGKRVFITMHRLILGIPTGDPRQVDHRNLNPLDNRRENLRICTIAENNQNRRKQSNSSSPYKGITLEKRTGKWKAQIQASGRHMVLGYFITPEDAHAAYCEAAKRYHGEFARTA